MKLTRAVNCAKERYKERINHETCAPAAVEDLPPSTDIYAGNETGRVVDSIAVSLGDWLVQNEQALHTMATSEAVGAVIDKLAQILANHGGQNGRRFRSGDRVMYLHLENRRVCTLQEPGIEYWSYDAGSAPKRCEMGHPW